MYKKQAALLLLLSLFFLAAAPTQAEPLQAAGSSGAPIVQNLTVETYTDVICTGTLSAVDNEGDSVTFAIDQYPQRGDVELAADGVTFVYTPHKGKTGTDTFTYTATDSDGNLSAPATVTVTVRKNTAGVFYSDMVGNSAHAAAIHLAEAGIWTGRQLGEQYFFDPDETVTRSEFLAAAMTAAEIPVSSAVQLTGFADDDAIAAWAKGYASAAVREGLVSGDASDGGMAFRGEDPITLREAAAIMNRLLEVTDVPLSEDSSGDWAAQAMANMISVQVVEAGAFGSSLPLTRGEAAKILSAAADLLEEEEVGFFHWPW